jgi:hypothetical protein
MSQVPLKRTPIAMSDYARGLIRAWHKALGVVPTKQAAGVLWAQYMIETGGRASWNWNIGNRKHVAGDGHDHVELSGVWEGFAPKVAEGMIARGEAIFSTNPDHIKAVGRGRVAVILQPGQPGSKFVAYDSLDEAMVSHLAFLRKRFASCWPAVEAGDCLAFAKRLKEGRDGIEGTSDDYFTADSGIYGNGMLGHHRQWMASVVYENAVGDLLAELDAPTVPVLVVDVENFKVVHPAVPLGRPLLDGDLPANDDDPDAA